MYDEPVDRLKEMGWNGLALLSPQSAKGTAQAKARAHGRDFWAVHDVSMNISRGETVGIIGRNGSGKSTLLQMICGTLAPTSGSVETSGRVAALLELGSGFNPEYSGHDNVYLNAQLLGLSRAQVDERYDDIVAFADIGDFLHQPVKTYSSGMLVRLAFGVIANVDADILVIDEALSVGDAFFGQKCMRFLRKFMRDNTVLFVSHDTSSINSLCSRAIWLEKGAVFADGSPKEISEQYLQAFVEANQGRSTTTMLKANFKEALAPTADQRAKFVNASNLRNDLQVFRFSEDARSFGKGGAQIVQVEFLDDAAQSLAWIVGGESVTLRITVAAHSRLASPIIGFYVKDKNGQNLFGDNTYLSYAMEPVAVEVGQTISAKFHFNMPTLPKGDYVVCAAVADGSQNEHIHHHWVHDAVLFRAEQDGVATGLVGIPMGKIVLQAHSHAPAPA